MLFSLLDPNKVRLLQYNQLLFCSYTRSSCSKLRVLQLLLKLDSGGHFGCEDLEYIDCVAYQFEPLSNVSYNVLDGELLEDGPIQAQMMPGGAQFFAAGVE